jgi:hypothetical protein
MVEKGTVADVTKTRGKINPDIGDGRQVKFTIKAVEGPRKQLRSHETVLFTRTSPGGLNASSVWPMTSDEAALSFKLATAFEKNIGGSRIQTTEQKEIARIAMQRAKRILKPLPGADGVPEDVRKARTALAIAAMQLMAIEAVHSAEGGKITSKSLGDVLRRQRPRLPK